jgi:hypothetical protein
MNGSWWVVIRDRSCLNRSHQSHSMSEYSLDYMKIDVKRSGSGLFAKDNRLVDNAPFQILWVVTADGDFWLHAGPSSSEWAQYKQWSTATTMIIQTIVKLWNKSKENLMSRSKTKQVRVSPKVPPNNQDGINVYQCYMQRVYNWSRTSTIKELSIKKWSLK